MTVTLNLLLVSYLQSGAYLVRNIRITGYGYRSKKFIRRATGWMKLFMNILIHLSIFLYLVFDCTYQMKSSWCVIGGDARLVNPVGKGAPLDRVPGSHTVQRKGTPESFRPSALSFPRGLTLHLMSLSAIPPNPAYRWRCFRHEIFHQRRCAQFSASSVHQDCSSVPIF